MKKLFWITVLFLLIPFAACTETIRVSPGTLTETLAACSDGDVSSAVPRTTLNAKCKMQNAKLNDTL